MSTINARNLRSADYFQSSHVPEASSDSVYSYVMTHKDHYGRLDIRADESGQFEILGSVIPEEPTPIGVVTWIPVVTTDPGKFERFLEPGPERVVATEPGTLLWFSLRDKMNPNHYAIIDLYADKRGLIKHNDGEVAAELKGNAPELVVGGWKHVISNAIVYKVQ